MGYGDRKCSRRDFLQWGGLGVTLIGTFLVPIPFLSKKCKDKKKIELNEALGGVSVEGSSTHISKTAPYEVTPFCLWINTVDNHLYIRDKTNMKWVRVPDKQEVIYYA